MGKRKAYNGKPGKRNNPGWINEGFVAIPHSMIDSPAYIKLTQPAKTAYTLPKRQKRSGIQDKVKFPYSHAERYMDRKIFTRAIRQLVELGFIEKEDYGGLYRRTNVYRFVEGWWQVC